MSDVAVVQPKHRTVAELVERIAILDAVTELASTRRDELKAELGVEAARVTAETGAAANFPVANVGRAYVTVPKEAAQIRDENVFVRWAKDSHPHMLAERLRINTLHLDAALAEHPEIRVALEQLHVLHTETIIDHDAIAGVLDDLIRGEQGELFDAAGTYTGIAFIARSKPVLTVKIDPSAKRRWQKMLASGFDRAAGVLGAALAETRPAPELAPGETEHGINPDYEAARSDQDPPW